MSLPEIVTREEWLAARKELLAREKAFTRARDELAADAASPADGADRKDYRFEGADGEVGLLDLFEGRQQLIVAHFMFDPSGRTGARAAPPAPTRWRRGCSSISTSATRRSPTCRARRTRSSRDYKAATRLDVPVVLVGGQRVQLRLPRHARPVGRVRCSTTSAPQDEFAAAGHELELEGEFPGRRSFLRDSDRVFHTYSVYARGTRDDRRFLLPAGRDRARPSGGVGGAQGAGRVRVRGATPDFAA